MMVRWQGCLIGNTRGWPLQGPTRGLEKYVKVPTLWNLCWNCWFFQCDWVDAKAHEAPKNACRKLWKLHWVPRKKGISKHVGDGIAIWLLQTALKDEPLSHLELGNRWKWEATKWLSMKRTISFSWIRLKCFYEKTLTIRGLLKELHSSELAAKPMVIKCLQATAKRPYYKRSKTTRERVRESSKRGEIYRTQ